MTGEKALDDDRDGRLARRRNFRSLGGLDTWEWVLLEVAAIGRDKMLVTEEADFE